MRRRKLIAKGQEARVYFEKTKKGARVVRISKRRKSLPGMERDFSRHKIAHTLFPRNFLNVHGASRTSAGKGKLISDFTKTDKTYAAYRKEFYAINEPPISPSRRAKAHIRRYDSKEVWRIIDKLRGWGINVNTHPVNMSFHGKHPVFFEIDWIDTDVLMERSAKLSGPLKEELRSLLKEHDKIKRRLRGH